MNRNIRTESLCKICKLCVRKTQAFCPYGSVHKENGKGNERKKGNAWLVVLFAILFLISVSVSLFHVKLTHVVSPYGSAHKQKGEGKEREKGNAWLVVPFTVSSVFVSLYLSYSKLTKEEYLAL